MPDTRLSIDGERFRINDALTYAEIDGSRPDAHGLLMNARFIQGVFDDTADRERYDRWGRGPFDAEAHTDALIAALPDWHAHGLRAFTVGFQGGGPCFTINRTSMCVNPFGEDGAALDPAYAGRMDRLIRSADALGMVVIVSYFYGAQARRLRDGRAVRAAVTVDVAAFADLKAVQHAMDAALGAADLAEMPLIFAADFNCRFDQPRTACRDADSFPPALAGALQASAVRRLPFSGLDGATVRGARSLTASWLMSGVRPARRRLWR